MESRDRDVRAAVYGITIDTGRVPSTRGLAVLLDREVDEIAGSLERLHDAHLLALAPDSREIWMAHPFSAVQTGFDVASREVRYVANCAWDALGILALLDRDGTAHASCADCGEDITLTVKEGALEPTSTVVHFLVPPARFYDDIGFT